MIWCGMNVSVRLDAVGAACFDRHDSLHLRRKSFTDRLIPSNPLMAFNSYPIINRRILSITSFLHHLLLLFETDQSNWMTQSKINNNRNQINNRIVTVTPIKQNKNVTVFFFQYFLRLIWFKSICDWVNDWRVDCGQKHETSLKITGYSILFGKTWSILVTELLTSCSYFLHPLEIDWTFTFHDSISPFCYRSVDYLSRSYRSVIFSHWNKKTNPVFTISWCLLVRITFDVAKAFFVVGKVTWCFGFGRHRPSPSLGRRSLRIDT